MIMTERFYIKSTYGEPSVQQDNHLLSWFLKMIHCSSFALLLKNTFDGASISTQQRDMVEVPGRVGTSSETE